MIKINYYLLIIKKNSMKSINKINNNWILQFKKPLIISGPCSAETYDQVIKTAKILKKNSIQIFRAGIWKPRTKPGNFEGIGEIGLKWLQKVKKETGMIVATEVANATHVKYAIEYDVDILWLGARSTVNPFTVQEIAESLKNTDKIILIKNPINPDFDLWIGAIERLLAQGVENIGVIHRGFSPYNGAPYRNIATWKVALYFRKIFPNIPILFDPSHVCGHKKGLLAFVQQALNYAYDGLMIESHNDPDSAWSDAKQQITPDSLLEFLKCLEHKHKNTKQKLDVLRLQINELDHNLIYLLSERFKLSNIIGKIKNKYNLPIMQNNKWEQIINKFKPYLFKLDISLFFSKKLLNSIHEESVNIQNKVMS